MPHNPDPSPKNSTSSATDRLWQILVIRANNWQYLHAESSWRPTITLTLDSLPSSSGYKHDVLLGTDGQNPNLRLSALLPPEVAPHSTLVIGMHYQPSAKRKGKSRKRRRRFGEARLSLEAALRQQTETAEGVCEVKIPIEFAEQKRKGSALAKLPSVLLRVRAPEGRAEIYSDAGGTLVDSCDGDTHSTTSGTVVSDEVLVSSSREISPASNSRLHGHKASKGFLPYDTSSSSTSHTVVEDDDEPESSPSTLPRTSGPRSQSTHDTHQPETNTVEGTSRSDGPSILRTLRTLYDAVTYHRELCEATNDAQREDLLSKLIREWQWVGGALLAIVALDTTVFGFNSGTLFGVDGFARRALTISAISSALGLAVDAVLLVSYFGATAERLRISSRSLHHSQFYFALTSRLPLVATLISILALAAFLLAVAYTAWPSAVLVISGLAGILLGLQYVVRAGELLGQTLAYGVLEMRDLLRTSRNITRTDTEMHPPMVPDIDLPMSGVSVHTAPDRAGGRSTRPSRASSDRRTSNGGRYQRRR
ncbi:unnamed protein product [Peniophora sp. CBMAI 1063]|nr:unnamed protein product [Peniophora sp. CBMAI 1063]